MIRAALIVAYGEQGRGVFTLQAIDAGEVIEVAPAFELPVQGMEDYVYIGSADGLARIVLGYGMLYNHAAEPNVLIEHQVTCTVFSAARDIEAGEELRVSYGDEWWTSRGREPRG